MSRRYKRLNGVYNENMKSFNELSTDTISFNNFSIKTYLKTNGF
jgi:hypothetical protein